MNQIIRYSGDKRFLVDLVNKYIKENKPNYKNYIEPFLCSGSIFFNLDSFDASKNYLISDRDPHIFNIHNTVSQTSFEEYKKDLSFVQSQFGNIKEDKEAYYNFRNWYNELGNKDPLFLIMLINSCLNSMLRFGPNGMNQSFGKRELDISEEVFKECSERLFQAYLFNSPFSQMLQNIGENSVVVLDPSHDKEFNRKELLDSLSRIPKDCLILYIDSENKESDKLLNLGWKKERLKKKRHSSFSESPGVSYYEVLYWKLT